MPNKKILVVDDEPAIVQILTQRLIAAGYAVCAAADGEEAVRKLRDERPDLVVMDVLMPKLTGYEALRRIRECADFERIPAIIISAKPSMASFFDGLARVEFLPKPYDPKALVEKIEGFLGQAAVGAKKSEELKRAVILGVQDFALNKIQTHLESMGFQVSRALNEHDAFKTAKNLHPNIILCQQWEDERVLDPRKLAKLLNEHGPLARVPLCIFTEPSGSIEAMKSFPTDQIISYRESADLLQKLDAHLKKLALI